MAKCSIDGCVKDTSASSRAMCERHYRLDLMRSAPECSIDGCGRPVRALNMCEKHYTRTRRTGTPDDPFLWNNSCGCRADDCNASAVTLGLCRKHYGFFRVYGDYNHVKIGGHGLSGTKIYQHWHNAVHSLPTSNGFKPYAPWVRNVSKFYADMGDCPDGYWLCRKDASIGYTRSNCYWGEPRESQKIRVWRNSKK